MILTRRNFLKMALLTSVVIPSLATTGCDIENISTDELRKYELVIFDIDNDEDNLNGMYSNSYEKIPKTKAIIIYYKYSIFAWDYERKDAKLTDVYETKEEADQELNDNFNIVFRDPLLKYLIAMHGPKNSYSQDEIKEVLDTFSLEKKTKQKTTKKR